MGILFFMVTLPIALPMHFLIRNDWCFELLKKIPYQPRILHWIIAIWGGLFWLDCPICDRKFGGHEKKGTLMLNHSLSQSVCSQCIEEANKLSKPINDSPMIIYY